MKSHFLKTNDVVLSSRWWLCPQALPHSILYLNESILAPAQLYSVCVCVCVLVTQSCLTVCNPTDCSSPGSSVHGILQARILEWVAMPFSRGSSQPMDQTWVSCSAGGFFTIWATREDHNFISSRSRPYSHSLSLSPCDLDWSVKSTKNPRET